MKLTGRYFWLSIFGSWACLFASPAQTPPVAFASVLLEAERDVTIKREPGGWQKPAALPEGLVPGDRVSTGESSRALVRLTDLSRLRLDELTEIVIAPPQRESAKETLNLTSGTIYLFSREKPRELEIRTPSATGALRGTEFVLRVVGSRTILTLLDGEVELRNQAGQGILLKSGEQGEVEPGRVPRKVPMIEAKNIVQWALYYPCILDPVELGLTADDRSPLSPSLAAYNAGDLLGALEKYPPALRPTTEAGRLYKAAVLLAVGQVEAARRLMAGVSPTSPGRLALEQMIAAVNFNEWPRKTESLTVGGCMAESYYAQSRSDLRQARIAAKRATEKNPAFGSAWVRLAELEFCFGRIPESIRALDRGLALSPRNAQGYALRGFLLSAENKIEHARAAFNEAIRLNGALANAWLGRGLTYIRQGQDERGRRDLQTAATLEPNRSILHSYLGKAFSEVGMTTLAKKDFVRAQELDPRDPTPWLYSAIENKQENRYNQAVDDLEKSIALNDNRSVYRSRLLLDQDRSIRGTNLAAIYLNDGMKEQSVREAVRAVDADYSSAASHLFLANSYNALRDPTRVLLRYETPWFHELLLSNLLSPVGGGPLSQFVSEQEYSKMFQQDGFGVSSDFYYLSDGQYQETASQYGTFGNFSYALDTQFFRDNGDRPNNEISRQESYAQFKFQLTPEDTLFFQAKIEDVSSGDVLQLYDQNSVATNPSALSQKFNEQQYPGLLLAGYHHEWSPGHHSLLLLGRLANRQQLTAQDTPQLLVTRDVSAQTKGLSTDYEYTPFLDPTVYGNLSPMTGTGTITGLSTIPLNFNYEPAFTTYTAEFQQILTFDSDCLVVGSRYQSGQFDTTSQLDYLGNSYQFADYYSNALGNQEEQVGLQLLNFYAYNIWHLTPWLSVTGGVTFDNLIYPENFRSPPINSDQQTLSKVSPKAGLILQPLPGMTMRAAYAQAISGASFDESVRLEPTEVAGFTQVYRSLASESLLGSTAGNVYNVWGISLEQKLPTRTYLGFQFNHVQQRVSRTIGVFDELRTPSGNYPTEILPSSLAENDRYREQSYLATVNQLVGENWSFGVAYLHTSSTLDQGYPALQASGLPPNQGTINSQAALGQTIFTALFNHPSGFFSTAAAKWYRQDIDLAQNVALPGDDFWQFDLIAGYRFYRNQCQVSCGVLNLTNANYQLYPLNPYENLPQGRTVVVSAKFSF